MKTRGRLAVIVKVGIGLMVAVACMAQGPKPGSVPAAKAGPPQKLGPHDAKDPGKPDEIRIRNADQSRIDTRRELYDLWGNVEFQDKDITVICDEARYDRKNDTAACAGRLKVTDAESVITGETMKADFTVERAIITGKVTIVTTKEVKREGEEQAKPEVRVTTITCDKVDYTFGEGKRRAIATGSIKAVQDDRTVVAQKADYDREKDVIVMTDDVTITQKDGSQFQCKKVTVCPSEDWVTMEGTKGTVVRDKRKAGVKPAGQ